MNKTDKESKDVETARNEGVDLQRVVIKPCPFCGSQESRYEFVGGINTVGIWKIACKSCMVSIQFQDSKQQALDVWNTRAL